MYYSIFPASVAPRVHQAIYARRRRITCICTSRIYCLACVCSDARPRTPSMAAIAFRDSSASNRRQAWRRAPPPAAALRVRPFGPPPCRDTKGGLRRTRRNTNRCGEQANHYALATNHFPCKPPKEAFSCRLEEPRSCPAGASGPKGRKGAATRFELARSCAATRPFKVGARRQTRTPAFVVARQRFLLLGSRVEHVERVDFLGRSWSRVAHTNMKCHRGLHNTKP